MEGFIPHPSVAAARRIDRVWPILAVVGVGALVRLVLWRTYTSLIYPDTTGWLSIARCLRSGDWSGEWGHKPPGYSVFCYIATLGLRPQLIGHIVGLQLVLGVATSVLVYLMVFQATGKRAAGLVAGIFYAACLNSASMEMMILPESLAAFWIALTLYLATRCAPQKRPSLWIWTAMGLAAAMAALTRPNNLFLLPFLFVWFFFAKRRQFHARSRMACFGAFVASAASPVLAWSTVLYCYLGHFAISTGDGIHLTQTTIDFVQLAPSRDAPLRDVLVRYQTPVCPRQIPLDSRIWFAMGDLMNLPIFHTQGIWRILEVADRLETMDVALIKAHPILYADAVAQGWWRSWFPRAFEPISQIRSFGPISPGGAPVLIWAGGEAWLSALAIPGDWMLRMTYFVLLAMLLPAGAFVFAGARRSGLFLPLMAWSLFLATLSSACIEYGNGRFPIPYEPLGISAIVVGASEIADRIAARRTGRTQMA
jgi:4-amino-4-deoxy-L-arabinose transferase-like glycosyltransferase